MKTKIKATFLRNIGIALSAVQFIISAVFCVQLFRLNMLPDRYSIGISVILLLLCVITLLLQSKKVPGIVGKIISLVLAAVLLFGSSLLSDLKVTIDSMTSSGNVQKEKINVYIMADREIPSDKEASGFTYGIMASAQGESLDNMMKILTEKFGSAPKTAEYKTAEDLAEALYKGKVEAIILSESFIPIITDIETYAAFETDTRILYSEEFSIAIESNDKDINSDTIVIYISGNDKKGSVEGVHRSDVNILAVANIKTKEILLVSTPRDYYVNLKYNDGSYSALPDKLTHAGNYGVNVSMNTLETIYDNMEIDYYFRVNFTGFVAIVDALGGVDVYVPKNFVANGAGHHFTQGNAHLNGEEALDFVRERYAFAGGDNRRGEAQMEVITSLLKKVMSPSVISGYREILDSLQRYFQTNIPSELISSLVKMQIEDGAEWNITSTSVTGTGSSEYTNSYPNRKLSVFLRNYSSEEQAKELIQKVLDGESLREEDND